MLVPKAYLHESASGYLSLLSSKVPATTPEFYEHNDVFHKPLAVSIYPFLGTELGEKFQNERLFP